MPKRNAHEIQERYEYGVSTVTSTGSIVIPARIRKAEGIKPGDTVVLVDVDGKVYLQKPPPKKVVAQLMRSLGA